MSLTFALDYDNTFTADRLLWSDFIHHAQSRGHTIYCVTARRDTAENLSELTADFESYSCNIPIVFSNLHSKVEEMDKQNIKIDIWIDDAPYALVHGHEL